ncbi:MAG: hypothetical protein H7175_11860 [Burkholderiales bacterium]|nr:hypothetical protein [Anaerolineae bacterium]
MRVPHPQPVKRRSRLPAFACGCVVTLVMVAAVMVVGLVLLGPSLPGLALQIFGGFSPAGNTNDVFAEVTPPPVVEVQNAVVPQEVVIQAGDLGSQTINPADVNADVLVGSSDTGAPLATVTFGEADLLLLCQQRSDVCAGTNPQFRVSQFDLRPGGVVAYGEAYVPQLNRWQALGVVMQLENSRQFRVVGIDINGQLFATPPDPNIQQLVAQAEQVGNDTLTQLAISAGGTTYTLSEVYADDNNLTLVLR